ncbi:MAG: hypothetical protein A2745_01595 [Candidatus Harrisonbacteria bacterium RIFCSPHIGHO2_01_FULL_44_13]|uniref:Uncharacterized protein n=1 Tax=Candidatus Harrisonbacteria bacterium RIFCSPLOWO2_01_FULL_44_18 TaxID=1798407 RepID=A0A1G1ZN32_9BACT|nr:MAG: hypothetical protein A2745_01595 [Candidatus Harrisonbacteria bacterium RIFCSPHIGHO2_01_FULL_44_13]OGY65170.1 MAG: hypothetical protein A3A16_00555 [Candidatus Harrisonbacteria bacterium RIFCSPLOWO2_01_FULL_44_18]
MAILVSEQKKPINWFAIIFVVILIALVAGGAYYLFFAPTPGIEIIVPPSLQSVTKISQVEFDPAAVVNSRAFKVLRSYTGLPSVGTLGRGNPFIGF